MKHQDLDFNVLIKQCKANKREYQEQLYIKFYSMVYKICLRYSSSKDEAYDYMQEIFIKAFDNLNKFSGKSYAEFGGWIGTISRNYCVDQYRKNKNINDVELCEIYEAKHMTMVEEYSDPKFEATDIFKAMHKLSPQYRMVFNMYVIDDMKHSDIADELGISIGTSKSNLHKARKKLKEILHHA